MIGVVGQLCDRNFVEIGIAEILRAIGEHPLFDFRVEMNILRRIQRHAFEVVSQIRLHLQELHEADPARTRRRRGDDAIAVPVGENGMSPDRPIVLEIALRDQPVTAHRRGDQVRRFAVVEILRALLGDARQHGGEIGLGEGRRPA